MNHGNSRQIFPGKWYALSWKQRYLLWGITGYKFFAKSFIFCDVIFFIEKYFFLHRHFFYRGNNLFFGMCSSVPFSPRSLASADPPRKFFFLYLPLGNISLGIQRYAAWNTYFVSTLKTGPWQLFCKGKFVIRGKQ